ncbi:MAG: hypothetical protein NZ889_01360 [Candidatus Pacearchaeota archaeon]|nr:hypothetical protein [Candidatus Pacearchaeota archaeon]
MKLLKKIAPIAIGAVFALSTVGSALGAATLGANWKNNFPAANTIIVVGDEHDDALALTEIARYLQISGVTTVTGESYLFEKRKDKLNLGEDLNQIRSTLTEEQLPTILAEEKYYDTNNEEFEYKQKITTSDEIKLTHFQDYDYKNNKPTLGFELESGTFVLDYTLEFSGTGPSFDGSTLEGTSIVLMGKEYYISKVDDTGITLLETTTKATVEEDATVNVGGKNIKIAYFSEGGKKVALVVDGVETTPIAEGKTYRLKDGTVIGVRTIIYDTRQGYKSKVVVTVGTGKIFLPKEGEVKINDKTVDGLNSYISSTDDNLQSITLEWTIDETSFLGPGDEIVMPGLKALKLMMTEMVFPAEERIEVDADRTKLLLRGVPIKEGKIDITLLSSNDEETWTHIGTESEPLKTSNTPTLKLQRKDSFFATLIKPLEDEGESYKITVTDFDKDKNTVTFASAGGKKCTVTQNEECEFGEVVFTVSGLNATAKEVNITAGEDVYFDVIVTNAGAVFTLPLSDELGSGTWSLSMIEEDEEGRIKEGKIIEFEAAIVDGKSTVKKIIATWAGGKMLEEDDDTDVGYVESPLATKVVYKTGGDQDDAIVSYFGDEVYGKVYLAGTGVTTATGGVGIMASELTAEMKATKNIVSIGGSGVNKFSAELLGLPFPTYGSSEEWISETGVEAGMALVKIFERTTVCPKVCLLVAGFHSQDTYRAAKFLTTKPEKLTGTEKLLRQADLATVA